MVPIEYRGPKINDGNHDERERERGGVIKIRSVNSKTLYLGD